MKELDSLFVPQLKVDLPNYITELLIYTKLQDRINKKMKGAMTSIPHCAFWRKDIADNHPQFKQLAKDYVAELTFVRKLLFSFSARAIINTIQSYNLITLVYQTVSQRKTIIYNIWEEHCKLTKATKKLKKKAPASQTGFTIKPRKTMDSGLTGLL